MGSVMFSMIMGFRGSGIPTGFRGSGIPVIPIPGFEQKPISHLLISADLLLEKVDVEINLLN